ncbi:MAG: hypothetical protein CSA20_08160 [Deltaproteobacteria bacterium]|nr:MAG: hypothetical protein CSA20_08160 [Deltaproteobacteria bacterium]
MYATVSDGEDFLYLLLRELKQRFLLAGTITSKVKSILLRALRKSVVLAAILWRIHPVQRGEMLPFSRAVNG